MVPKCTNAKLLKAAADKAEKMLPKNIEHYNDVFRIVPNSANLAHENYSTCPQL